MYAAHTPIHTQTHTHKHARTHMHTHTHTNTQMHNIHTRTLLYEQTKAAMFNRSEVAMMLIRAGANPYKKSKTHGTPIHLALPFLANKMTKLAVQLKH